MTFSIVACDVKTGQWGVAVQSKYLAAGAVVWRGVCAAGGNSNPSTGLLVTLR